MIVMSVTCWLKQLQQILLRVLLVSTQSGKSGIWFQFWINVDKCKKEMYEKIFVFPDFFPSSFVCIPSPHFLLCILPSFCLISLSLHPTAISSLCPSFCLFFLESFHPICLQWCLIVSSLLGSFFILSDNPVLSSFYQYVIASLLLLFLQVS